MSDLTGKRVLVVDDEPDICDMVVEQLDACQVDTANTYEQAREKLAKSQYDAVMLDIMGVRGHDLRDEFAGKVPTIMLTAHALTPRDLVQSIKGKAVLYLPKEELGNIDVYVHRALEAKGSQWSWLFKRLDFTKWFGPGWMSILGDIDFQLEEADVMNDLAEWR